MARHPTARGCCLDRSSAHLARAVLLLRVPEHRACGEWSATAEFRTLSVPESATFGRCNSAEVSWKGNRTHLKTTAKGRPRCGTVPRGVAVAASAAGAQGTGGAGCLHQTSFA